MVASWVLPLPSLRCRVGLPRFSLPKIWVLGGGGIRQTPFGRETTSVTFHITIVGVPWVERERLVIVVRILVFFGWVGLGI